ncbi:uncharacterized protein PITG_19024 [Phytophthora infestans T30-4]|uniref:Uncharacterized protein n=1 Tax=Phytophthora infestans (strain T30-4) TaxID=403677 RepID=D0NYS5_PHYIT|nr:uncharacterized protein PITG_19024 [Phytophthora infestans T30-4]EEY68704.1 conserved hypothetical protein [Phytophthora infestans T30-4]|eukprot:XP_002997510.1 conserved hypothetical protein [Phytophthora infestans T30-4]
MLDTKNATEDTPTSQDAKTLVPMSLSLVAKKEKILQMEVAKLGKLLAQRNEMLDGLQESHEYLLTTNGQLQERSRLRRERLVSLRTLLEAGQEQHGKDKTGVCDVIGVNELDATAEKCGVLKGIILGLVDKRAGLEQQCMGLEEQTAREAVALRAKEERLSEVRNSLLLLHEDIHSTQWNFANDEAELSAEDKHLNAVSQNAQSEAAAVEKVDTALRAEKAAVEDLRATWLNYEDMVHEEHRQITIENEDARSEQRKCQKLLESNGEELTSTKFFKRELALRKKQEKDMLAIAQSSIKAKEEQLTWLDRQRLHLENEQNEAVKVHAADEAAYRTFVKEHKSAMASLEAQIKGIEKELKSTERAITARNKKVATINKKTVQKSKVLQEWKVKIDAKQDQVTKSAATQGLVDAELLNMQESLKQEQLRVAQIQGLLKAQEMESEELHSSCAVVESEIQNTHTSLATMRANITATQTAVKNRIDEVRDKFLSAFVIEDAENLIQLLNKEIESWTTKDSVEVDEAIARHTMKLKQKYDALMAENRKKFGKTLLQKEKQYNAKLDKLKKTTAAKKSKPAASSTNKAKIVKKHSMDEPAPQIFVSATSHEHDSDETMGNPAPEENDTNNRDPDPTRMERPINGGDLSKAPPSKMRLSELHTTQREASGAPKPTPKPVRRGLNLVDESPQTDKELADIFTADGTRLDNASGVRPRRLKRRTPAQKAGKPESTLSTTALIAHQYSTTERPSQHPLNSPVGCDEDFAAMSRASQDEDTTKKTPSTTHQAADNKPLLQKADQRSKGVAKRRTSKKTKALHRVRHSKASRISLGRTMDWSTAETFSFD